MKLTGIEPVVHWLRGRSGRNWIACGKPHKPIRFYLTASYYRHGWRYVNYNVNGKPHAKHRWLKYVTCETCIVRIR